MLPGDIASQTLLELEVMSAESKLRENLERLWADFGDKVGHLGPAEGILSVSYSYTLKGAREKSKVDRALRIPLKS